MAVLAVVDVTNVEVDTSVSPMVCKPYVAIWVAGSTEDLFQDFLPAANYEATSVGAAGANAGILAAAKAVCQAEPYNVTFGMLDTVQMVRGIG